MSMNDVVKNQIFEQVKLRLGIRSGGRTELYSSFDSIYKSQLHCALNDVDWDFAIRKEELKLIPKNPNAPSQPPSYSLPTGYVKCLNLGDYRGSCKNCCNRTHGIQALTAILIDNELTFNYNDCPDFNYHGYIYYISDNFTTTEPKGEFINLVSLYICNILGNLYNKTVEQLNFLSSELTKLKREVQGKIPKEFNKGKNIATEPVHRNTYGATIKHNKRL